MSVSFNSRRSKSMYISLKIFSYVTNIGICKSTFKGKAIKCISHGFALSIAI